MTTKTVDELRNQLNASQQQYKRLLEKNQNDLIWIKQRQALVKKSLADMEAQKNTWKDSQSRLVLENQFLKKELSKLQQGDKHGQETINSLEARIDHLEQSIKQLEQSKLDLDKRNRNLTIRIQETEKQKDSIANLLKQSLGSLESASKLNQSLKQESQTIRLQNLTLTRKQEVISIDVQTQIFQQQQKPDHSKEIQQLYQNSQLEIEEKATQVKIMQQKLGQSIEQLKLIFEKNKVLSDEVLQLKKHCFEADDSLQKTKLKLEEEKRKNRQLSVNNLNSSELGIKTNELEQENKILKEMIKSLKTMVRVREVEVEKYRNKLHNEEKNHKIYEQKQNKSILMQKGYGQQKKTQRPESNQRSQRIHRLSYEKLILTPKLHHKRDKKRNYQSLNDIFKLMRFFNNSNE